MAIVNSNTPKGFQDFNLKELLLLIIEHSLDVGTIALLLIAEKYGEAGLRCVVAIKDHSTSERRGFLVNFLQDIAGVDLREKKFSRKRTHEEMLAFAGPYPSVGEAKTYVKLCEMLEKESA